MGQSEILLQSITKNKHRTLKPGFWWFKSRVGQMTCFRGYLKQRSANVAMFMALSILPISILIGVAMDGGRISNARQDLQATLDAAVLAAAIEYFKTGGQDETAAQTAARTAGETHFARQIALARRTSRDEQVSFTFTTDKRIVATMTASVDTLFGGLVGQDEANISLTAEAVAGGGRKLEIALVLDNSSSMFSDNRMQIMRGAARDFANRLFDTLGEDNVKISVVPWAATVNIKSEAVAAKDDSAYSGSMPTVPAGSRLVPNAPGGSPWTYTEDPFTGAAISTSSQADALFAPTQWRGCIRAADGERRVNASGNVLSALTDEFPASDWPLGLVPPDLSPFYTVAPIACGVGGTGGTATPPSGTQAGLEGGASLAAVYAIPGAEPKGQIVPARQLACWQASGHDTNRLDRWQWHDWGRRNPYFPIDMTTWEYSDYTMPAVSRTSVACLGDPNEFKYWDDGRPDCEFAPSLSAGFPDPILPWDTHKAITGPNLNCPSAILPASSNRRQVIRKLDHMYPVPGGTQADVGLMWALRTLSPRAEWTSFFDLPTDMVPAAFGDASTLKVAVLLTDGLNEAPIDFEGYYGCTKSGRATGYDVGDPEDWEESTDCWQSPDIATLDKDSLDALMIDACTAMKGSYGIRLYTIAVDINDPSAVGLLKSCASSESEFFNISASQIDPTFNSILTQMVRLSR